MAQRNPSKITTDLVVDDPLVQGPRFRLDADDRQYIDNQIRGVQDHLEKLVLSGLTGTYGTLDASSSPVVAGAALVTNGGAVTLATSTSLTAANKRIAGIALVAAAPGGRVRYASAGTIPASVTGLGSGAPSPVTVNQTTGLLVRTPIPSPTDIVVGDVDALGAMTLGSHGAGSQFDPIVANIADFGATGHSSDDATPAFQAAFATASANTGDPLYPTYRQLYISTGSQNIRRPVRIKQAYFEVAGAGRTSVIRPTFQGATFMVGPDLSAHPMVTSGGPFGGNCMNPGGALNHWVELKRLGCAQLDGLTAFTVEGWIKLTSTITGGAASCVLLGYGKELDLAPGDTSLSLTFVSGPDYGGANNVPQGRARINGVDHIISNASVSLTTNVWTHVGLDYDGTKLRLLVGGSVAASVAATGTLTQKPWETLCLGVGYGSLFLDVVYGFFAGQIGPFRICNASVYGSAIGAGTTYTVPTAPFQVAPPDGPQAAFSSVFVTDWASSYTSPIDGTVPVPYQGDVYYASSGGRPVWFRGMGAGGTPAVTGAVIRDLQIYANNGASSGGIEIHECVGYDVRNILTLTTFYSLISENNSFYGKTYNINHSGTHEWVGFLIATTSGDIHRNLTSENCTYPIAFTGGATIDTFSIGQWAPNCAGFYARNPQFLSLHNGFWDSEAQTSSSRGCLFVTNGKIVATGLGLAGSFIPGTNVPAATFDVVEGYVSGFVGAQDSASSFFTTLGAPSSSLELDVFEYGFGSIPPPLLNNVVGNITVTRRERNGVASIAISGDTTLTMDQWTYRTINFTGSTAATVTVPALAGWRRTLHNLSTQVIAIAPIGGGYGFDLAPGDRIEMSSDGTNIYVENVGGEWRVKTTSTDGRAASYHGVTETSNATPATVITVPIADNAVSRFDAVVSARSGANAWTQSLRKTFVRSGGGSPSALSGGPMDPVADTSGTTTGWSSAISISGNNAIVTVTGAASTTIDWDVVVDRKRVA